MRERGKPRGPRYPTRRRSGGDYAFVDALRAVFGLGPMNRREPPEPETTQDFPEPGWQPVSGGTMRSRTRGGG